MNNYIVSIFDFIFTVLYNYVLFVLVIQKSLHITRNHSESIHTFVILIIITFIT